MAFNIYDYIHNYTLYELPSDVTSVTVPNEVRKFHSNAFYYATGLKELNIPENFPYIPCVFEKNTELSGTFDAKGAVIRPHAFIPTKIDKILWRSASGKLYELPNDPDVLDTTYFQNDIILQDALDGKKILSQIPYNIFYAFPSKNLFVKIAFLTGAYDKNPNTVKRALDFVESIKKLLSHDEIETVEKSVLVEQLISFDEAVALQFMGYIKQDPSFIHYTGPFFARHPQIRQQFKKDCSNLRYKVKKGDVQAKENLDAMKKQGVTLEYVKKFLDEHNLVPRPGCEALCAEVMKYRVKQYDYVRYEELYLEALRRNAPKTIAQTKDSAQTSVRYEWLDPKDVRLYTIGNVIATCLGLGNYFTDAYPMLQECALEPNTQAIVFCNEKGKIIARAPSHYSPKTKQLCFTPIYDRAATEKERRGIMDALERAIADQREAMQEKLKLVTLDVSDDNTKRMNKLINEKYHAVRVLPYHIFKNLFHGGNGGGYGSEYEKQTVLYEAPIPIRKKTRKNATHVGPSMSARQQPSVIL